MANKCSAAAPYGSLLFFDIQISKWPPHFGFVCSSLRDTRATLLFSDLSALQRFSPPITLNYSIRPKPSVHLSVSPPKFEGDAGLKLEKVFRGHPFMTSAKFSDFWTPPVHIWSQYTVLNPRNLLYIVHISTNHPCPSPLGADIINGRPLRGVIPFAMVRKNIA